MRSVPVNQIETAPMAAKTSDAFILAVLDLVNFADESRTVFDNRNALAEGISKQFSAISENERRLFVPPALPRLMEILGARLTHVEPFQRALESPNAQVPDLMCSPSAFIDIQANRLMWRSLTDGLDDALAEFVRTLLTTPVSRWQRDENRQLGLFLLKNHWFEGPLKQTAKAVRRLRRNSSQPDYVIRSLALIQILGFSNTAPLPWLRVLFDNVILPTISAAATANLYDVVLGLEYSAYNNYTKAKDEAEHFRTTVNKWIPDLRKSGKSLAAKLPPLTANGNTGSPPRVAFYLQNSEILGHTEALVSFLRGLTKVKPTPLEALLYIAGPANPDLDALLTNCPVEIVYVDTLVAENPTMSQVLMALRADCAKNGVVAFVYVSLVLTMAFGFAMGLAPVQIWWSMKYHSLEFSEIDGYLALGSFDPYREIDGRRWRAVHRAMGPLVDPGLAKNAVRIRRKLLGRRGTVLLGCIGREEKMICEPYIAALTGILASVPEAVYFWTGKTEHPGVIGLLRKYGIEEKCRYVGWIDTRLYAQVVDVFVDSFPFASGLTAFEAMAAGRPVVSMLTRESLGTGMPAHVWPAYAGQSGTPELQREVQRIFSDTDGSSLLPFAETVESYRRIAVKLCRDSILRANVGNACRLFVERYMSNDERMAETGSRHILEIIDAKLDHRRRVG